MVGSMADGMLRKNDRFAVGKKVVSNLSGVHLLMRSS